MLLQIALVQWALRRGEHSVSVDDGIISIIVLNRMEVSFILCNKIKDI